MHTVAEYIGANKTIDGDIILSFAVDEDSQAIDQLEKMLGEEVVIDIEKLRGKRSLNANNYFWSLCSKIAKKLGIKLETAYIMQLTSYGVFSDVEVVKEALGILQASFRYVEVLEENDTHCYARCWLGSSHFDTKQMSDLINGAINDCNDLGIETWSREEIEMLLQNWRKDNERTFEHRT